MIAFDKNRINLLNRDFLEAIEYFFQSSYQFDLFEESHSKYNNKFNIVIANPPYVRTQILGSKESPILLKKIQLKRES